MTGDEEVVEASSEIGDSAARTVALAVTAERTVENAWQKTRMKACRKNSACCAYFAAERERLGGRRSVDRN